jgi:hypothetical protein
MPGRPDSPISMPPEATATPKPPTGPNANEVKADGINQSRPASRALSPTADTEYHDPPTTGTHTPKSQIGNLPGQEKRVFQPPGLPVRAAPAVSAAPIRSDVLQGAKPDQHTHHRPSGEAISLNLSDSTGPEEPQAGGTRPPTPPKPPKRTGGYGHEIGPEGAGNERERARNSPSELPHSDTPRVETKYAISALATGEHSEVTNGNRDRIFENVVAYEDWVTRHTLSMYPEGHPIVDYTRDLFARGLSTEDAEGFNLSVYHGDPNAFCLPNGAIFVSDGLLQLSDTEEGVISMLDHEKNHVVKEHAKRKDEFDQIREPENIIKQSLSHMGQALFHEWESDVSMFTAAEERGINPMGGVDLMEKLRQREKGIDITHGQMASRVLNLRTLTRIRDIATIQDPMNPFPQEIQDQFMKAPPQQPEYHTFLAQFEDRNSRGISKSLEKMNAQTAMLVLPHVLEQYVHQRKTPHGERWADSQQQIIAILGQKVWTHIARTFPDQGDMQLSDKQKTFLFHSLLSLAGKSQSTKENEAHPDIFTHPAFKTLTIDRTLFPWNKRKINFQEQLYTSEDVEAFLEVLTPEHFSRLGITLVTAPDKLIHDLTKRVLTREMLVDYNEADEFVFDTSAYVTYAATLTDKVAALYEAGGAVEIRKNKDICRRDKTGKRFPN